MEENMPQKIALMAAVLCRGRSKGVYGIDGKLPWQVKQLPGQQIIRSDMENFVTKTKERSGNLLVCGRATYESLKNHHLEGRQLLVLSSTMKPEHGVYLCRKPQHLFETAKEIAGNSLDIYSIGGLEVWRAGFPDYTHLYITEVDAEYDHESDDVLAHYIDLLEISKKHPEFDCTSRNTLVDTGSGLPITFVEYERRK
jgi:dihydrofolate reductase